MPVVQEPYGPTLPELLRPRLRRLPRAAQLALAGLVALVVVALAVAVASRGSGVTQVIVHSPVVFNLTYAGGLRPVAPHTGESVRLEGRTADGTFVQSLAVRPLHLPAYRGDFNAFLPVYAAGYLQQLARRFPALTPTNEGRARVNDAMGYEVQFLTNVGDRTAFGRHLLLLPGQPGARDGVVIEMLATYRAAVSATDQVGVFGALKQTMRSFRFGTQAP
jgi:hypothetical protein